MLQTSALSRRRLLTRLGAVAAAAFAWRTRPAAQAGIPLVVYKDPRCECCQKWVDHMTANGFAATVTDTADINAVKRVQHVAEPLWSCHTALVGGYVIEGHVPATDVQKLLAQKPKGTLGLTIPGMPASAPGMDGQPFRSFTVLAFDIEGRTTTFARHDRA